MVRFGPGVEVLGLIMILRYWKVTVVDWMVDSLPDPGSRARYISPQTSLKFCTFGLYRCPY